jgi:2-keto-4-pentenoate hydratase/2-oxohepta-3-ene-1,7-dioic acid hydratase in catechol pathway
LDYVYGYTIANDVTARDLQRSDVQWTRGKGFDTFCPLGPWIDTDFDPVDALITCHVNEELRQMASTRDMFFTVPQLVVFISSVMTLEPGDIILTGTPSGVGDLMDGDTVRITVEGLGTLANPVIAERPQHQSV